VLPLRLRDLELELDAFEGPFDLLLTLLLREELEPRDIDIAAIVLAFVEHMAERPSSPRPALAQAGQSPAPPSPRENEASELDLDACGEFLVLVSALLELKARALFPDEEAELGELEPEEAAEELARRLAEYRRMKEAAAWLLERLGGEQGRWFRLGPAPFAPEPERRLAPQDPAALADAVRLLAVTPPTVSLGHMALRFPPVSQFLERFRVLLGHRRRFDFDSEVEGLSRVEQAVALLALLELRKSGEIALSQARAFAPIRVSSTSRAAPALAGRSPAPPRPDAANETTPSVQSTVPSGLASLATPREAEAGFRAVDDERTTEWKARSA
jgi:segregation and condensation protein A